MEVGGAAHLKGSNKIWEPMIRKTGHQTPRAAVPANSRRRWLATEFIQMVLDFSMLLSFGFASLQVEVTVPHEFQGVGIALINKRKGQLTVSASTVWPPRLLALTAYRPSLCPHQR